MIVSNSRKFIFVHLHKTAGTAITRELESGSQWNDIVLSGRNRGSVRPGWYADRYQLETHSGASAIKNVVGDAVWNDYFTFTFVRDPYRRILSLYTWLDGLVSSKKGLWYFERYLRPNHRFWAWPGTKAYLESRNFSEFIRHPFIQDGAPGAVPMTNSLYKNGVLLVDFVGKQESLDADIGKIKSQLGLTNEKVQPNNMTKARIEPNEFYTSQQDLDFIYEKYKLDFENFGYDRKLVGQL